MSEPLVAAPCVKAVIFDVDGTLYRQGPVRRGMARRLLRAHLLHPITGLRTVRVLAAYRRAQEELRSSPDRHDLAEAQLRLAGERTGVDRDTVARWVERWMETGPLDLIALSRQPDLQASLLTLRDWGIRLAVLSDYPAEDKLEALGIAELFDVVLCSQQSEIGTFKPHPRGLEVALERLEATGAEVVYVGDRADVDAVAAAAAHVPCFILAGSGHAAEGDGFVPVSSFQDITHRLEPI
jgi:FMN phosphatase YigB (HAD superfamily)